MEKIFDFRLSYRITLILIALYTVLIVVFPVRNAPLWMFYEGGSETAGAREFVEVRLKSVKFFIHKTVYYQVVRCGGSASNPADIIREGSFQIERGGSGMFHLQMPFPSTNGAGTNRYQPLINGGVQMAELYMTLDMNGNYLSNRAPDKNDRVLQRRVIAFTDNRVVTIDQSELRDLSRPNVVKLKIYGLPEAAGNRVLFRLVKFHGSQTNISHIIAEGVFRIKKNGSGGSLAYYVDSMGNRTGAPASFRSTRVLDLYLFLDMNGDYARDPRPNGQDKIIEAKGVVVNGYTVINIQPSDLQTHKPGMTFAEYARLTNIAREYGQGSGLRSEVALAMNYVSYYPDMIKNPTNRYAFCVQNPTNTAAALCTTISRYLYLHALNILYPGSVTNLPQQFWLYYISMVDHGYVGIAGSRFCFVTYAAPMVGNYLRDKPREDYDWEYNRNVDFTNDTEAIELLRRRGSQVVIIREGENPYYSSHSFLAVLTVDGVYRMVDPGYNKWTGLPIQERYQPGTGRYIHVIQGYAQTEL